VAIINKRMKFRDVIARERSRVRVAEINRQIIKREKNLGNIGRRLRREREDNYGFDYNRGGSFKFRKGLPRWGFALQMGPGLQCSIGLAPLLQRGETPRDRRCRRLF
jgi:hypothetical protein